MFLLHLIFCFSLQIQLPADIVLVWRCFWSFSAAMSTPAFCPQSKRRWRGRHFASSSNNEWNAKLKDILPFRVSLAKRLERRHTKGDTRECLPRRVANCWHWFRWPRHSSNNTSRWSSSLIWQSLYSSLNSGLNFRRPSRWSSRDLLEMRNCDKNEIQSTQPAV